jgi:hypothetical protein
MPLTHPEFGYIGTSSFRRGVIAFVICGLVACASGIAVFKENLDPDPLTAMALAPAEPLSGTARVSPMRIVEGNSGQDKLGQEALKGTAIKPDCESGNMGHLVGDCLAPRQITRPRSIRALNEQPPIGAAPIGRLEGLPDLPSKSTIPVGVTAEAPADSANPANLTDVAPAVDTPPVSTEASAPPASAQRIRIRGNYVQRRGSRSASNSKHYNQPNYQRNYQSGYARLW